MTDPDRKEWNAASCEPADGAAGAGPEGTGRKTRDTDGGISAALAAFSARQARSRGLSPVAPPAAGGLGPPRWLDLHHHAIPAQKDVSPARSRAQHEADAAAKPAHPPRRDEPADD